MNKGRSELKILALDLGTKTGWALKWGEQLTSGTWNLKGDRFSSPGFRAIIFRNYLEKIKPQYIFYEEVRRHMSTDSAHWFGGFWLTLMAFCEEYKIEHMGLPVGTIKERVTGRGNASKNHVFLVMKEKYPRQMVETADQADAIAILETGMELYNPLRKKRGRPPKNDRD
jgi:hypothetical protein